MKKSSKKNTVLEIVLYSLFGAVALWGLTYVVLGIIVNFLPSEADLLLADKAIKNAFGLSFLWWGMIIMAIGAVSVIITLSAFAKKYDRNVERETRRAARLAQVKTANKDEVVDASFNDAVKE